MSEQPIPDSRAYRHVQCGDETLVGGQSFEVVSNPMSSMERTFCSTCNAMFPIADYEWCDTGENLAAYYARHTTTATDLQRFLCSKKFMVALIGLGAVLTAAGCYYLVRDQILLAKTICLFAGLVVGAVIGGAVFLNVFEKPITRKVCGVRDTRLLT
jgi:hypothetical protein